MHVRGRGMGEVILPGVLTVKNTKQNVQERTLPFFGSSKRFVLVEFLSPFNNLPTSCTNATDHYTVDLLGLLARIMKIVLVNFRILMFLAFFRVISLSCTHFQHLVDRNWLVYAITNTWFGWFDFITCFIEPAFLLLSCLRCCSQKQVQIVACAYVLP